MTRLLDLVAFLETGAAAGEPVAKPANYFIAGIRNFSNNPECRR
jgi:hypothetical protein